MIFKSNLCTCVSKANFKTPFCMANNIFEIFKKWENLFKILQKKRQLLNLIFKKSREYGNFENRVTPPPTWHQILKPIRMLAAIFYYIYKYVYTLSIYPQSMKNIKGHFWYSVPSHPSHPIPSNLTSYFETHKNVGDNFYFV